MRTSFIVLFASAVLMSSTSVMAFRDQSQTVQIERAIAAKKAAAAELAATRQVQNATSVAGAKGDEGRVGPSGAAVTPQRRPPFFRNHP